MSKPGRISGLLVISFNRKDSGLSDRVRIVANLLSRPSGGQVIHEVRSKETGLGHRGMDSERRQLVVRGFCNSFHGKLGRTVNAPSCRCPETAARDEKLYDVAGSLLAHCWKHYPDDIQQPENICAVVAFDLFAVVSSIAASIPKPALLTRTSILPKRPILSRTPDLTCASFVTSISTGNRAF